MAWVIDGNAAGFDEFGSGCFDAAAARRVTRDARAVLGRAAALLDRRRSAGFVRQCHGDLHLRNIVLLDGVPTLFDAVEFNDEISCVDVLYDVAFLLMDLWRRALPVHANRLFNRYLFETGELEGVSLLSLFLSCRAAVRAKTSATAAALHEDATRRDALQRLAREYLDLAGRLLHPPQPALVAVGGLSGSGKSTLALALAPLIGAAPGAVVLRSDEIRKQLCGVPSFERLGPEGYRPEVSARVYETMSARARAVLRGGHSVILDGVYARRENRREIAHLAAATSVPLIGFWLEAPEPVLMARAAGRLNDPSDADASVIRVQAAQDTGMIEWRRLDASRSPEAVFHEAMASLRGRLSEHAAASATPASS
jgi:predicted kinase